MECGETQCNAIIQHFQKSFMKQLSHQPILILVSLICIFSIIAASMGIFSTGGKGEYPFQSIRGKTVMIYGQGLYRDMSAEVAPQGIAQDYITLFAAVPMLIISLFFTLKKSLRGKYLLAGTIAYFFVTYLFYTVMAMFNSLFLIYVLLMGLSFFTLALITSSFDFNHLKENFKSTTPVKLTGGFLIFISVAIALLWLNIVVPPLFSGTIPIETEHYTTLIVQGLDLGILLPTAFISGILLRKKQPAGYLLAPVYFIFLSLLMTALTAKIIAMKSLGYNVVPAIFIIPVFNVMVIFSAIILLKNIKASKLNEDE
jgi:hypothetical protein